MNDKLLVLFKSLKEINFKDTTKNIKGCDFLLFCHDVNRGVSLNGQAYSPLIDSLKDEFEGKSYTCITIAHPWSEIVGESAYGEPIAINRSYFFSKVFKKLFGKFGFRPDLKLYESVIKKANPKVIITIGCSNELCEAARNMQVFHVELLHGIGYAAIPWGWNDKKKEHLPQGILSLDALSTETFSELEGKEVLIKEIPHPFLSRFQEKNIDKIPVEWLTNKKDKRYKKEILISLQWGYAPGIDEHDFLKGTLSNGLFYNELEEVIKKTHNTVFWHFRLHPVQYRQAKKYKTLIDFMDSFVESHNNCEWRESTYLPLPALLRQCSGNITMFSMTSYEAAYTGVKTLALCPSLRNGGIYKDAFSDLIEQGYLLKQPAQLDSILEWVNNVEKIEPLLTNINETDSTVDWLLSQV